MRQTFVIRNYMKLCNKQNLDFKTKEEQQQQQQQQKKKKGVCKNQQNKIFLMWVIIALYLMQLAQCNTVPIDIFQ